MRYGCGGLWELEIDHSAGFASTLDQLVICLPLSRRHQEIVLVQGAAVNIIRGTQTALVKSNLSVVAHMLMESLVRPAAN